MIDLRSERLRATVDPAHGACIVALDGWSGLRWVPVLAAASGRRDLPPAIASALFAMVPFANRAPGNRLELGGQVFDLPRNAADPLAIHGTGWERPWEVASRDERSCRLRLSVGRDAYPFAFRARLAIALDATGADVTLTLQNRDPGPIPGGLGFHPYFPRDDGTTVRFQATHFWLEGPGHLPTSAIAVPPELDFAVARPLPEAWRNNAYSGWDGTADIGQPRLGYGLRLEATGLLPELMLYAPPGEGRFAIEPQSHTSGATSSGAAAPARGLAALAPGEERTASIRLALTWA